MSFSDWELWYSSWVTQLPWCRRWGWRSCWGQARRSREPPCSPAQYYREGNFMFKIGLHCVDRAKGGRVLVRRRKRASCKGDWSDTFWLLPRMDWSTSSSSPTACKRESCPGKTILPFNCSSFSFNFLSSVTPPPKTTAVILNWSAAPLQLFYFPYTLLNKCSLFIHKIIRED